MGYVPIRLREQRASLENHLLSLIDSESPTNSPNSESDSPQKPEKIPTSSKE